MTLVDGDELLRIIVAGLDGASLELRAPSAATVRARPECGRQLVRRMARRGPHAGEEFRGYRF